MDAALTMRMLQCIADTPVLFADVRHHHADLGIWDLCNSGQHATWFAARSDDPAENLRHVHLYPEEFYFPAGGASIFTAAACFAAASSISCVWMSAGERPNAYFGEMACEARQISP